MSDNETTGTGKPVATDKVTYSGDADQNVQLVRLVQVTGAEGSKTVVDLPGDATNGLDVDLTRLPTRTVDINATLTRPADTTAYADGDSVSSSTSAPTILTFSNCVQASGGTGMIVAATMRDSAYSATPGIFELWLLDTTTTPDNDNAAFTPTDGEVDTCIAVVRFSLVYPGDKTAGATGNMLYVASGLNIPFVAAGTSLFGIVVVRGAYTPISAETFKFRLKILQN